MASWYLPASSWRVWSDSFMICLLLSVQQIFQTPLWLTNCLQSLGWLGAQSSWVQGRVRACHTCDGGSGSQMCSCCIHWHSWAHIPLVMLGTAIVGHRFYLQLNWAPQFSLWSGKTDMKTLGMWLLWKLEQNITKCEEETSLNLCASTFSIFSSVGNSSSNAHAWRMSKERIKCQDTRSMLSIPSPSLL